MRDGAILSAWRVEPVGRPRGWVLLVHGVAEHSGRYLQVTEALQRAGFGVVAYDARGHGLSAEGRPTAFVEDIATHVDDVGEMFTWMHDQAAGAPCFILGHSMGALLTLACLLRRPADVAGAVLTGTPWAPMGDVSGPAWWVARLVSRLLPKLPGARLDSSAISRDPAEVRKYDEDPLVFRGWLPVRTGVELLQEAHRLRSVPLSLAVPLLVMHGTDDRVAHIEGSRQLVASLDPSITTYVECEGLYHEILNEPEGPELLAQIVVWLRQQSESVQQPHRA